MREHVPAMGDLAIRQAGAALDQGSTERSNAFRAMAVALRPEAGKTEDVIPRPRAL
jgi:hypothetical protein